MVLQLIHNVALLIALAVALQMLAHRTARNPLTYRLIAGMLFGAVCIVGMLTPLQFTPGIIYDARSVILSIAGLFGGPIVAVIAVLMAASYRIFLGGAGMLVGVLTIIESASLGVLLYYLRKRSESWSTWPVLLAFGVVVHLGMLALQLLLPEQQGWKILHQVGPAILVFFPLGFLLVASVFLQGEKRRFAERRLSRVRAIQRAMVSCSPLALYSCDMDGNTLTWNESAERLFGWSKEDVLGKPLPIVPQDKQEEFEKLCQRVRSGESFTGVEVVRRKKDGSRFIANLAVAPMVDENAKPFGIFGAMEDVTARIRNAEALREQEQRYRSLFENNHAVILLLDPKTGEIVDANPAAERFYGWTRDQLLKKNITEINIASVSEIMAEMEKAKREDRKHFEFQHRRADGSVRNVEVYSGPLRIQQRDLLYSIIHDITDKTIAEASLRKSESRLRRAQRVAHVGDWEFYLDQDAIDSSEESRRIYGVDSEKWSISDVQKIPLPEYREMLDDALENLIKHGKRYDVEFKIQRPSDGKVVDIHSVAQYDEQNNVVFGVIQDITDRKRAEEAEAQLREQLMQSQKMEAIGRLAGGMAHDFNNMLQTILGYSDMLLSEVPEDHPFRESLQEIRKAGSRSADLTRQLLGFARKQTVSPETLDLNDAISQLLKMLERLISEDIEMQWIPSKEECPVTIDPTQVNQILTNLVVNARDAISGIGKITIETAHKHVDSTYAHLHPDARQGDYELLVVSDNGCGMDRKTLKQACEPFFTTKGKEEGTGLGLATVYGIVRQNNGFINIYSEPGEGTTVRVYFPTSENRQPVQLDRKEKDTLPKGSETVLLVEDEPALLKLSKSILQRLGYKVIFTDQPEDAIALAEENRGKIDLLITDVIMPQISGRDLHDRLVKKYPNLRCLYMSGYSENVVAHHGVLDSGIDFLQKPFTTEDLATKLRDILDADKNDSARE